MVLTEKTFYFIILFTIESGEKNPSPFALCIFVGLYQLLCLREGLSRYPNSLVSKNTTIVGNTRKAHITRRQSQGRDVYRYHHFTTVSGEKITPCRRMCIRGPLLI